MTDKIHVMLVEDHAGYREVIARALKSERDITLTSQFGTAEIALRSLQNHDTQQVPDLILLDLNLPGMSGLDALPRFLDALPNAYGAQYRAVNRVPSGETKTGAPLSTGRPYDG